MGAALPAVSQELILEAKLVSNIFIGEGIIGPMSFTSKE